MIEPIYRDKAGKPVKLIYEAVLKVKPAAGPTVAQVEAVRAQAEKDKLDKTRIPVGVVYISKAGKCTVCS